MEKFEEKNDLLKKAIIQAVIPGLIIHQDNTVELRVNPNPTGAANHRSGPFPRHGGGKDLVLSQSWRSVRDSNPRPSA